MWKIQIAGDQTQALLRLLVDWMVWWWNPAKYKYTNANTQIQKTQYKYRQWSDTTPGRFVGWLAGGGESLPATASITHHGHQPPMLWSSWSSLSWSPSPSWPSCPPWPSWSPSSWYQSWPLSLASATNHQCCDDHDHLDRHDNLDQHHHPKSATFMKVNNCLFWPLIWFFTFTFSIFLHIRLSFSQPSTPTLGGRTWYPTR